MSPNTWFIIFMICWYGWALWSGLRRNKRELLQRRQPPHVTIDWESLHNLEYIMEVMRQFRENRPSVNYETVEKVHWQKEGF